jgi:hypothetical protein
MQSANPREMDNKAESDSSNTYLIFYLYSITFCAKCAWERGGGARLLLGAFAVRTNALCAGHKQC